MFWNPRFASQIWISGFGSQYFDLWVCVSGLRSLGLALRIWIPRFWSQDLDR